MTVTRTDTPGASESVPSGGSTDAGEPALHSEAPAAAPQRTPIEIVALAAVAAAVGIAFRFVARTPLWLDEALSVNIASLSPGEINEALRHDGHPPLYYYLLHYWMQLFGQGDVAVRALSGVVSVVTLPVAWFAGRRRGGPLLGWVLVSVLSISTFAVRYATETRMYSLLMLLVFVAYFLLDDVVRRDRSSWWRLVALGVVSGLLVLTHYWAMFLLAAVGVVLLWRFWRTRDARARNALIAMVVGSVLLFLPWFGAFRFQSAHTGTPWASPFRPTTTVAVAFQDFHTVTSDFKDPILALSMTAVLLCLGLFGVAISSRRIELDLRTVRQVRYEGLVVGLTFGIAIVVGLATRSAFASRYAAVLYPLVLLLIAAGVTRFVSRPVRFGVLAVYLALSVIGVFHAAVVYQRTESREVAAEVAARAQPGDLVVYCPDQLGPDGQREMPGDVRQVAYPTLGPPERIDWLDYSARNAAADPEAIAQKAGEMAGSGHSIFVVWAGSYKTFEGQCERFMHGLLQQRPITEDLVTGDSDKYFEHENLKRFMPAPSS